MHWEGRRLGVCIWVEERAKEKSRERLQECRGVKGRLQAEVCMGVRGGRREV